MTESGIDAFAPLERFADQCKGPILGLARCPCRTRNGLQAVAVSQAAGMPAETPATPSRTCALLGPTLAPLHRPANRSSSSQ